MKAGRLVVALALAAAVHGAPGNEEASQWVVLKEVSFSGCHEWMESDDGETIYSPPHAKDETGNDTFDDVGDRNYPVCFSVEDEMKLSATWAIRGGKPPAGSKFYVKCDGPGKLGFDATVAVYDPESGKISVKEVSAGFMGKAAAALKGEEFRWSIGWDGEDGQRYWVPAGVNKNRVYTILRRREHAMAGYGERGASLYETIVDISSIACRDL